jgi:hypothetical protein
MTPVNRRDINNTQILVIWIIKLTPNAQQLTRIRKFLHGDEATCG